jgi:hypothetical protein
VGEHGHEHVQRCVCVVIGGYAVDVIVYVL